jgi:hypothetical protein
MELLFFILELLLRSRGVVVMWVADSPLHLKNNQIAKNVILSRTFAKILHLDLSQSRNANLMKTIIYGMALAVAGCSKAAAPHEIDWRIPQSMNAAFCRIITDDKLQTCSSVQEILDRLHPEPYEGVRIEHNANGAAQLRCAYTGGIIYVNTSLPTWRNQTKAPSTIAAYMIIDTEKGQDIAAMTFDGKFIREPIAEMRDHLASSGLFLPNTGDSHP